MAELAQYRGRNKANKQTYNDNYNHQFEKGKTGLASQSPVSSFNRE